MPRAEKALLLGFSAMDDQVAHPAAKTLATMPHACNAFAIATLHKRVLTCLIKRGDTLPPAVTWVDYMPPRDQRGFSHGYPGPLSPTPKVLCQLAQGRREARAPTLGSHH